MTNRKSTSQTGDESGPRPSAASKEKEAPIRMHEVPGRIPRKIIKSMYDPRQNCVIDVIEIERTVQNRKGDDVHVVSTRHVRSRNEALQAKHTIDPNKAVDLEVSDV